MVIGSDQYLIAASLQTSSSSFGTNSVVFKHNSTLQRFASVQLIATFGASGVEVFTVSSQLYVFISNHRDNSNFNINSEVLRWDIAQSKFVSHQLIPTSGAVYSKSFLIDGALHLAVPQFYNGSSYAINSPVFKWCGGKFVLN